MRYEVSLSNKKSIFITEDEYKKLIENIDKNFVLLGNEMVNPSFIVSVIEVIEWASDTPAIREPRKRIVGHIDEERRVYVIDKEEIIDDEPLLIG